MVELGEVHSDMLRPLATLCVLLLSLAGTIPTAAACTFQMQGADCCLGRPCGPQRVPTVADSVGLPCCAAQPAPAQSAMAATMESDRRFAEFPTPDDGATSVFEFRSVFTPSYEWRHITAAAPIKFDQQQIYLRTARLRL